MHRLLLFIFTLLAAGIFSGPAGANDAKACVGHGDAVIAACSRAIASGKWKGRNLSILHTNRSLAYNKKGETERTIADLNEAIRLNPKLAVAYATRSYAYITKGEYDHAIADASEAIRLDPKSDVAWNNRGFAYSKKGEEERAIADLNEAIRLGPAQWEGYKNRGISFERKGELKNAMADFQAAARLAPQSQEVMDGVRRVEQKLASAAPQVVPAPSQIASTAPQLVPATAVAPVMAAQDGRRVALVIGNGRYRHASVLPNPVNDAADLSQALRRLGFEVVEGRDLDRRGMDEKLREFGRKLDNASLALFFYAGHGIQVGGRNYLVPVDAKLERAGDLNLDAVDVGNVLAQMEAERRVNLVFLDACRDNPLARSFARSLGTRSTSVGQGLATIQSAVGTLIAYATQPDNVALDGVGRNSPFTAALLKHIATPGLHISLVMQRVRADVLAATRDKQVPWDHSSLIGEVILAR